MIKAYVVLPENLSNGLRKYVICSLAVYVASYNFLG